MREVHPFPEGLKVGDFVQSTMHFGDVYLEAKFVIKPSDDCPHWLVLCHAYDRTGKNVGTSIGPSEGLRRVVPAEMGLPVLVAKRARIHSSIGLFA